MEEPIRVAHIMGKMISGGVESVVMNYYKNIDKTKVQFDFIVDEDSTHIPLEEIEGMGGKVIIVPPYQNIRSYVKSLKQIFKNENYKIVHSHLNALSIIPLYAAKKSNVSVRIAHSHSTTNKKEWKKNLIKNILKMFSKIYPTNYFSCSELAGRWLFGNKLYNSGQVKVLNNAIDLDRFDYNEEIRSEMRKKLDIEDRFVIGHVGRFVKQKNHLKLINIFYEIYKKDNNAVLILIGDGPLLPVIKEKVENLLINENVIFLGIREDINELMQAMDVFLFPSLYEGLGMVLIEAQSIGIPCITSTEVPKEAKITGIIEFLSLDKEDTYWANKVLEKKMSYIRKSYGQEVSLSGYNIKQEAKNLEKKYYELLNDLKNKNIE